MDDGRGVPGRDADLVRAALGADKDAFAELVRRHWATALALATRLLGSADLATDAVQEASIAAMTGLDRLRAPDRFGAWFCGITLNVARQWLRQLRAEVPAVLADGRSGEPGPDEQAEIAELGALVRASVARLPAGQRQAVILFYLQGLAHREVAAELCISVGAVKARLHQARAALTPALRPLVSATGAPGKETAMTTQAADTTWTEVVVTEIRRDDSDPARPVHVMMLDERDGERRLPIWIGPSEATAMALVLQAEEIPRPLTHQLTSSLLRAAGAGVAEVRITRLAGQVFYAIVAVSGAAGRQEVDARPSDAVNLALVTGAPIQVETGLLDERLDNAAPGRSRWRDLPASTAELAAEALGQMHAHLAEPG